MVKTYKTGSSTLGALLHRFGDLRGLDVAVNAKALKGVRSLERHLHPGTMPKPTECLYEFHTFKPCGGSWLAAQANAAIEGLEPKPLQIVIDHSRWQPLAELLNAGRSGAARSASIGSACTRFVERMRGTAGAAHRLFVGDGATSAATELDRCVRELNAEWAARSSSSGSAELAAPSAYRETVPGGLLVTIMRWPPARFTSALEQFSMPQQTGVPCSRTRALRGGACYGHTCERDFRFTWNCMNQTVHRFGMLATVMRCLVDRSSAAERATVRLADLRAMSSHQPPSQLAATLHRTLRAKLVAESAAQLATGRPSSGGRRAAMARGLRQRPPSCASAKRPLARRREIPSSFRFIGEAVANTLGWPQTMLPLTDNYWRMLGEGGGGGRGGGRGGGAAERGPRLMLDWVAALSRSLDLVLISEHFDESLLVLSRMLQVPSHVLLYISQKRRAKLKTPLPGERSPAALAAASTRDLVNVTRWPEDAMLRDHNGPWLWPSDLDGALRVNWLDSLAYMYYNASLWARIEALWPGTEGKAVMQAELAGFREMRAAAVSGCAQCEKLGAAGCLDAARGSAFRITPHFCWSLRQDTRSWSEHFFKRMALRFDAAAAARESASGTEKAAGVTTGNVKWWRCPDTRGIAERCHRLQSHPRHAGLWDCACQW